MNRRGAPLSTPAGSTSFFPRWRIPSLPIRVSDPGVSPLVACNPTVRRCRLAPVVARRELHLATLFSRTYAHIHTDETPPPPPSRNSSPDSLFSHRDGYTPDRTRPRSRDAQPVNYTITPIFFLPFPSPISLPRADCSRWRLSSLLLSRARSLARSHSFRSRPCVCVSRARGAHTASPPPLRPVNTKHAGRRTNGHEHSRRFEIEERSCARVDVSRGLFRTTRDPKSSPSRPTATNVAAHTHKRIQTNTPGERTPTPRDHTFYLFLALYLCPRRTLLRVAFALSISHGQVARAALSLSLSLTRPCSLPLYILLSCSS